MRAESIITVTPVWPGERRRARRHALSHDADVEVVGDDVYPAALMNISRSGCRLMVDGSLTVAALIWIRVADFAPILARIAWIEGTVMGCEFGEPLTRTALLALRKLETASATPHGEPEELDR